MRRIEANARRAKLSTPRKQESTGVSLNWLAQTARAAP